MAETETWILDEEGRWKRCVHAGLWLDAFADSSPRVVSLLVAGTGPEDDEQLFAAIRLARRLATARLEVVAASVHPTATWLASVREVGADLALLVSQTKDHRWCEKPPLNDVIELDGCICPELHASHERGITASVCGRHKDRMTLARHHLNRWCLANKEDCPHWQGGPCD